MSKQAATRLADALERLHAQKVPHSVRHGEVCGVADYRLVANERDIGVML